MEPGFIVFVTLTVLASMEVVSGSELEDQKLILEDQKLILEVYPSDVLKGLENVGLNFSIQGPIL